MMTVPFLAGHRYLSFSAFCSSFCSAFFTAVLCAPVASQGSPGPSGGVLSPEQAAYDVLHYALLLDVDPDEQCIDGSLAMRARIVEDLDKVVLDLDERLQVSKVALGTRDLEFEHAAGRITAKLPAVAKKGEELIVIVHYGGKPRVAPSPPWNGGFTWSETKDGRPWIATSCQGEGADLWWPCKDHPSDKPDGFDLYITVPKKLVCASNGVLVGTKKNRDGTRTFHWRVSSPISNYCVALNIAPYKVIEKTYKSVTGEKIPVFFYALPESVKKARKALPEFLDHLRFFEETCGPYPFRHEKYGIAETPHLGMEHQTIIAYGNRFRRSGRKYDWLHHHELSHEWWGNLVTCRDWKDMWIHEGFGTYMQALYLEKKFGRRAYEVEMRSKGRFANRGAVAPREATDSKAIYFRGGGGNDIYNKGSWILHTLRWLIGDERFFVSLRRFCYPTEAMEKVTDGSQVRLVDTDDYRKLVEELTGQDLSWFFDVYLHQARLPQLTETREGNQLTLRWVVPDGLLFPMPVPVVINGKTRRVEVTTEGVTIKVAESAKVKLDPKRLVLRSGR